MAELTVEDVAANLRSFMESSRKLHRETYEVFQDFYRGGTSATGYLRKHDRETAAAWARRQRRLVGANVSAVIVDKIVRAEYGSPATRSFGMDTASEQLAAEFEDAIDKRRVHPSRIMTARQRAVDGTAIVNLYWDADRKKVQWKHELASTVFPIILGDWEKLDAVLIDRGRVADLSPQGTHGVPTGDAEAQINESRGDKYILWPEAVAHMNGAGQQNAHFIEIYTPIESGVVVATMDDGGEVAQNSVMRVDTADLAFFEERQEYGCIPLVWFYGRRLVGDVFGQSMLRGIVEINQAVNAGLSNLGEVVRMQGFSLLVIQGDIGGVQTDETGRAKLDVSQNTALYLDSEGKVYFADPSPKIAECIELINREIALAFEVGNVPIAVVQPQQEHAESAASRQVQFMPLIDLVTELETWDAESEFDFTTKVMHISRRMRGNASSDIAAVRDELSPLFNVAWSENYYPTDQETTLNVYTQRRELGLESRKMQLQREYPDLDDDGIDKLMEDIDNEKDHDDERAAFAERKAHPERERFGAQGRDDFEQ